MEIILNSTLLLEENSTNSSWITPEDKLENGSTYANDFIPQTNTLRLSPVSQVTDFSLTTTVSLSVLLGMLILATIVGNLFVMAAILKERILQTVGNYLVFSLAVADLMVACLVMPMGALYEVTNHEWMLGPELCEVWTSGDVLCCTASILHLLAIALDRYWAVTNIDYVRQRSGRRIGFMIFLVWTVGFLVSIAPILGWKDDHFLHRIQEEKRCLVSQDAGYQIFATCSTFYVPLIAILMLYWRVYQVARNRIRHKPGHVVRPSTLLPLVAESTAMTTTAFNGSGHMPELLRAKKKARESIELKRERKAAKTLVIITGVFVICWLPFFVSALLMSLCPSCHLDHRLFSLFLWLGYANSTLNPLIYTLFSPDFRKAFAVLLCLNQEK